MGKYYLLNPNNKRKPKVISEEEYLEMLAGKKLNPVSKKRRTKMKKRKKSATSRKRKPSKKARRKSIRKAVKKVLTKRTKRKSAKKRKRKVKKNSWFKQPIRHKRAALKGIRRRKRKVKKNSWPKQPIRHKRAAIKGWKKKTRKIRKNAWFEEPKRHRIASKKGWGQRKKGTKGYKMASGYELLRNPFKSKRIRKNPFISKKRRKSKRGRSLVSGIRVKRNPNPLVTFQNSLKTITDIKFVKKASLVTAGSLSAGLLSGMIKSRVKQLPDNAAVNIALEGASGALVATLAGTVTKNKNVTRDMVLGTIAGIFDDIGRRLITPMLTKMSAKKSEESMSGLTENLQQSFGLGDSVQDSFHLGEYLTSDQLGDYATVESISSAESAGTYGETF